MDAKQITSLFRQATFGSKIAIWELRHRYDVFHMEDLYDDGHHVGFELTAPGTLYRNVGFQKSVQPMDFSIRMPNQQFIVNGVAHWPFEALNIQLDVEPAYHEFATELAKKALCTGRDNEKILRRTHYGVMPGFITHTNGCPVFTIDPERADTALFYADRSLKGFAGYRRLNCIGVGIINIVLIPVPVAAELVA